MVRDSKGTITWTPSRSRFSDLRGHVVHVRGVQPCAITSVSTSEAPIDREGSSPRLTVVIVIVIERKLIGAIGAIVRPPMHDIAAYAYI